MKKKLTRILLITVLACALLFGMSTSALAGYTGDNPGTAGTGSFTVTGTTDTGVAGHTATSGRYYYYNYFGAANGVSHNIYCNCGDTTITHYWTYTSYYPTTTLQEALLAGTPITLYDDFWQTIGGDRLVSAQGTEANRVTNAIDLNGHQFGGPAGEEFVLLDYYCTMTIRDGGNDGVAYIEGRDGTGILTVKSGTVYVKGTFNQINVEGGAVFDYDDRDAEPDPIDESVTITNNIDALVVTGGDVELDGPGGSITGDADGDGTGYAVKVSGTGDVFIANYTVTLGATSTSTTTAYVGEGGELELSVGTEVNAYSKYGVWLHDSGWLIIDGAEVNAEGEYGVFVEPIGDDDACNFDMTAGVINVDTNNAEGRYDNAHNCYGVYVAANDDTVQADVDITGGTINVDANTTPDAHAYGVFNQSGITDIDGGEESPVVINAVAVANISYVYGVSSKRDESVVTIDGNTTINVAAFTQTVSGGYYHGISNHAGEVTMLGGAVNVGHVQGTNPKKSVQSGSNVFGLDAPHAAVTNMSGGEMTVYGERAKGYYLYDTAAEAEVYMRGGTLTVIDNNSYGVYVDGGLFEMGVHEQTALPANQGALHNGAANSGYPYIKMEFNSDSKGVYSNDAASVARLFAGEIYTGGDRAHAVYVNAGNLQVLANEHTPDIEDIAETTFIATASGDSGIAFYAANNHWAIRGRGSLFTGDRFAFVARLGSYNDGGVWYDDNCDIDTASPYGDGEGNAPISGGTFIGGMNIATSGVLGDLILGNHYMRDAAVDYNGDNDGDGYWNPSDGRYPVEDMAEKSTTKDITIVNAEWELRYALEYDNDINTYNMPVDITLDYCYYLHGNNGQNGDVDVCVNTAVGATEPDHGDGHILYLNGKKLDNINPAEAPFFPDDQIIEVHEVGKLLVSSLGWDAAAYEGQGAYAPVGDGKNTNGLITNTNVDDEAILNKGTVIIAGGTVQGAPNTTGDNGSNASGIIQEAGFLSVLGGHILGSNDKDTNSLNSTIAVWIKGGDMEVRPGDPGAGIDDPIIGPLATTPDSSGGDTAIKFDSPGTLKVYGGKIYGDYNSGYGIWATNGVTDISGGIIKRDDNNDGQAAILVDGAPAEVNVETNAAHDIGTVNVNAGQYNLKDGTAENPSTIYALNVYGTGSAYITGGVVEEDSAVSGTNETIFGELKVEDGVFKQDLFVYETGKAYFVRSKDVDETTGEITYGTVKGTVYVGVDTAPEGVLASGIQPDPNNDPAAGLPTLLVEYGDFNKVISYVDGENIDLHGGLYNRIENAGAVDTRFIGEKALTDTFSMIPVNHYLISTTGSSLYRTDADFAQAADGDKMLLLNVLATEGPYNIYSVLEGAGYGSTYKMPCFIDLCGFEDGYCGLIEYTFRTVTGGPTINDGPNFFNCFPEEAEKPDGTLEITKVCTLDLNGYDLTSSEDNHYPINILTNGDLTVKDDTNTDGRIFDGNDIPVRLEETGILRLQSGSIVATAATAVIAENSSDVYVDGGNIIGDVYGLRFNSNGKLIIEYGTFKGGDEANQYALYVTDGDICIKGGIFGDTLTPATINGAYFKDFDKALLTGGRYESIENAKNGGTLNDLLHKFTVVTADDVTKVGGDYDPENDAAKPDPIYVYPDASAYQDLMDSSIKQGDAAPPTTKATDDPEVTITTDWTYDAMFTLTTTDCEPDWPPIPPPPPTPPTPGPSAPVEIREEVPIIVDGVTYYIGEESISRDITKVTANQEELLKRLEKAKVSVVFPIEANTGGVAAQLVLENIEDMAKKGMTLAVEWDDIIYELPATAVDTAAIMNALGAKDSANVPVIITIEKAGGNINVPGAKIVLDPVEFTFQATSGNRTYTLSTFGEYVARIIRVSESQAKEITTAVVYEPSGRVRHIPTDVYTTGGRWYARINSLTDSVYVLIYNEQSFADAQGKWYQAIVNEMASRKIIEGRGASIFDGEANITRAEFAAIIVRALGLPENGNAQFVDVPTSAWYYGAVGKAYEYGIIQGRSATVFAPGENITRQDAMLMLQRASLITGYVPVNNGAYGAFNDLDTVAGYASDAMYWNLQNGFIVGSDGLVRPLDNISRAESATIILRLLQKSELIDVRSKA